MVAGLSFLELELSEATSCISAAKRFTEPEGRLDVLIANAALAIILSYLLWALDRALRRAEQMPIRRRQRHCQVMTLRYSSL